MNRRPIWIQNVTLIGSIMYLYVYFLYKVAEISTFKIADKIADETVCLASKKLQYIGLWSGWATFTPNQFLLNLL